MTERITAAEKAIEVTKERNDQYGPSTAVTARLWSSYLDTTVTASDVALMMVLFKLGRELTNEGEDNLVDMHGYLMVYERILND